MTRRQARQIALRAAAAYLRDSDDNLLTTDGNGVMYSEADLGRIEMERRALAVRLDWRAKGLEGHQILAAVRRRSEEAK